MSSAGNASPIARAQTSYTLISELGHGEFAIVYLAVEKATANEIINQYRSHSISKAEALRQLRANYQAVKVKNQHAVNVDSPAIAVEIRILMRLNGEYNHISIPRFLASDPAAMGQKTYLSMRPICSAVSLQDLETKWQIEDKDVPLAFAWHLLAQSVGVFLYLHFGWHNGRTTANRPRLSHNDAHAGNVLFNLPSPGNGGSTGNYPNLTLIDFGNGTEAFNNRQQQAVDISRMASWLQTIESKVWDDDEDEQEAFGPVVDKVAGLNASNYGDEGLDTLIQVYNEAIGKRNQLYRPLPNNYVEYFRSAGSSDRVRDGKLVEVFPELGR
jgi:serine/threonine protein kinase